MYSCGLFETKVTALEAQESGGMRGSHLMKYQPVLKFCGSLESAQVRKIDALLQRLEPISPNHTLLDIGFGWGGICIRAAEKYGCRVTGITLSVEQKALAEAAVKQKGLGHLITFELVDYRVFAERYRFSGEEKARGGSKCVSAEHGRNDTLGLAAGPKRFDRIVSCEMIEAVGHNHLDDFFAAAEMLLGENGIMVMQAITMPDARYPNYVRSADFCNTIIFPGGCCPSMSALLSAMARRSTLHLENAANYGLHYAETLRCWRRRFNAQLPRVKELGFDAAFIRLWNLYFCYCEAGFEAQVINLHMLTFSRPGNANVIVRQHIPADH